MSLANHAALERALTETEARLQALDTPAPDQGGDEADQRTARQNAEDVVTERARLEQHRRFLLSALTKIERGRGEFGRCESCRGTIAAKRLGAIPWAIYCVSCAESAEASAAAEHRPVSSSDHDAEAE